MVCRCINLGGGSGGIELFGLGVPGVDGVGVLKFGDGKLNSSYLLGRVPGVVTKVFDPDGDGDPAVEDLNIRPE